MTELGHPLAAAAPAGEPDSLAAKVSRAARKHIEAATEDAPLIGFFSVGLYADGTFGCGYQTPENHIIGPTLFTAFIKEIVERELTGIFAADDYAREYLS